VKENQEKDKIKSKPDKNGKRVKARKSLKQLQWIKEEKPKKTQKEWSKTHTRPTTHSDISLSEYDSFIFDLTHEELVDELAHVISLSEYDCFYFKDLPDQGELMSVLNSGIRENLLSTNLVNLPIEDDHSPLLAYVVWIFVAYLTYPVIPPYLHPFRNEDTIFDPGITINHFYSCEPISSHRHGAFRKFYTHRSHLNEWPMIINGKNTPFLDVLLILGNLKTLAKGFYPPSLNFPSFNWESYILRVTSNKDESNGVEADVSNMETTIIASPTPTLRIHRDHPKSQIIGPVDTLIQTRNKSKEAREQKPKKIFDALQDPSWVEAIQEELFQFKIQKVWSLVDCPKGEEGIDYDEVFAHVARIEAIRLFLAYASFMDFTVYQMDVKSAFLYGTIDEEVYVMQPPGFQDPEYPARVYKV
nr:hypothetical protein [Tanacetum cinerariifolium]